MPHRRIRSIGNCPGGSFFSRCFSKDKKTPTGFDSATKIKIAGQANSCLSSLRSSGILYSRILQDLGNNNHSSYPLLVGKVPVGSYLRRINWKGFMQCRPRSWLFVSVVVPLCQSGKRGRRSCGFPDPFRQGTSREVLSRLCGWFLCLWLVSPAS